jgi:hypothetical protein
MLSPVAHWRSAAADTFALVVYCFIAGMAIEILVSGMSFQQSLSSRLLSIPVNILIARRFQRQPFLLRNLADLLAYVSFQSPVYAAILWSVGADGQQIITAVTSNAVVSMAMGVVYGYFLEYCRRLFRVAGYV